jgi:hypothetical protein
LLLITTLWKPSIATQSVSSLVASSIEIVQIPLDISSPQLKNSSPEGKFVAGYMAEHRIGGFSSTDLLAAKPYRSYIQMECMILGVVWNMAKALIQSCFDPPKTVVCLQGTVSVFGWNVVSVFINICSLQPK